MILGRDKVGIPFAQFSFWWTFALLNECSALGAYTIKLVLTLKMIQLCSALDCIVVQWNLYCTNSLFRNWCNGVLIQNRSSRAPREHDSFVLFPELICTLNGLLLMNKIQTAETGKNDLPISKHWALFEVVTARRARLQLVSVLYAIKKKFVLLSSSLGIALSLCSLQLLFKV